MHCIESIGYDFYYGILLKKFQWNILTYSEIQLNIYIYIYIYPYVNPVLISLLTFFIDCGYLEFSRNQNVDNVYNLI